MLCRLLYFNLKCNTIQLVPQSNVSSHPSLRPETIAINEQVLDATFTIKIVRIVRPLSSNPTQIICSSTRLSIFDCYTKPVVKGVELEPDQYHVFGTLFELFPVALTRPYKKLRNM
jgi:hypothetical protein